MRILALMFVAWLWAVVSVQAHQSDAKHCDNTTDTDQLSECLTENSTKSNLWVRYKTTNAETADGLEARLESHDHIACGEKSGHLELVFVCSEHAPMFCDWHMPICRSCTVWSVQYKDWGKNGKNLVALP